MSSFWLCFVPLFVAVDAIGLLPLFLSLTEGMEKKRIRKIILQSMITALAVALIFIAVGTGIFRLLNISVADFMIAGGTLLFVISVRDILFADKKLPDVDLDSVGAVPIGVPLITGPAVLTTSLLLINQHSVVVTSLAIAANILIVGGMFLLAPLIHRLLGKTGAKALSKIISLLLAAIGVMIVRKGIAMFIAEGMQC
ncbi:MAG: MarC family protein [Syntrophaceae bacterium]|nr:MarC family protein [Syntrophaceae bacterium]HOC58326.1 MarC family protein [Smithellaceae bacterium]HQM44723.1 MarC family protein [Smithellaceae bacterium]